MSEKQISTGEAAAISGLTVRTLQHYDNIGVLPASGRTEGGRRYYTEADLVNLERVVFYRSLGFTLDQIKEELLDNPVIESVNELLEQQKYLLYNRTYTIQNSIAAIEASQEIIGAGKKPPWRLLSAFMRSLNTVDLSSWSQFDFSDEQKEVFDAYLPTLDHVMEFYNTWRRLTIKAAAYCEAEIQVHEPIARKLAAEWTAMVEQVTGGEEVHQSAYLEVDQQRDMWNPQEKILIEKGEPYLEKLIDSYQK